MNQDTEPYIQLCSAYIKRFRIQCPVSIQSRSHLKAMKTPPWASPTLSYRMASKESGKISEFLISGVNQDSFPKMMSGFAESIIV